MKKFLIIMLVVVVSLSLAFVGCKAAGEETTAASTTAASTTAASAETTAAAAEEEVTITWMDWWESSVGTELLDNIEAKFTEEHPNVKIVREDLPYLQYAEKVVTLGQADILPDVMGMAGLWTVLLNPYDVLEPLDPWMEKDGISRDDFGIIQDYNGVTWMSPVYSLVMALCVNKTLLDEKGIETPQTWDEFLTAAREVNNPDKGVYATIIDAAPDGTFFQAWFYPLLLEAGGRWVDDEYNIVYNDEAGVAAMEFLGTLYNEDLVYPGTLTNTQNERMLGFTSGNIAMVTLNTPALAELNAADLPFEWEYALMPEGPGGSRGTLALSGDLAMSSKSKNKEMAWEFIKYVTTGEGNKMWCEAASQTSAWKEYLNLPYINEDPNLKICAEQLKDPGNILYPNFDNMGIAIECWQDEFYNYLQGNKSAKQALDDSIISFKDRVANL